MHGFAERGGEPPPPHEDERIFAEERWFSVDRQADAYVELLKATSRAQYCSLIRRSRKIENRKRARSTLAFSGLFYLFTEVPRSGVLGSSYPRSCIAPPRSPQKRTSWKGCIAPARQGL
jgi:hypothetical protein